MIICINGVVNSGKTTIGKLLAEKLPNALFIDGDDNGLEDEHRLKEHIQASMTYIQQSIQNIKKEYLVVAYPLRQIDYDFIQSECVKTEQELYVITLNTPESIALTNRGERKLMAWERKRIKEMYKQGYATRSFSNWFVDNGSLTPNQTVDILIDKIKKK
ncbi:hypothetical protein [Flavobacterium sp. '19STA2R22 D10 B1']|uniref:hypothetical protein n=1 Tax=Flavobacterium aerium TaxID=3037261 RepID=UPI00278BCDE3|nr:hypothetical protein [Flavobacterium sp. '19STA2R22 D10 B1']